MGIAKHLLQHLGLILLVAGFWIWQTGNWLLLLPAFAFGILIDLDHWLDYWFAFGFEINLKKFFNPAGYVNKNQKVYVLLHGWEYLLPLFFLGRFWETKLFVSGLTGTIVTAYLAHLIFDSITVVQSAKGYFLTYRLLSKFSLKAFNEK